MTDQITRTPLLPFGLLLTAPHGISLTDIPPDQLARWTEESRVLVLRGFPLLEKDEFAEYCRQWGELLTWDFGAVLDLVVKDNPSNYLFAPGDVPFHWDGAFTPTTPGFFLFQCLDAEPGAGGETVFCDTTQVYRHAPEEIRSRWADVTVSYHTEKLAHYGGEVTRPLLSTHPRSGLPTLRFAEPLPAERFLNPLDVRVDGVPEDEVPAFLDDLTERLHDPAFCYPHAWLPGDIVIADNHALVHGRNAFTGSPKRHLQRVQVI